MDQEDTNLSLMLQGRLELIDFFFVFSCRWPRTVCMHSRTASSLSTSPAWSEFLELIMIQEEEEAQEYQAHPP